MIKSKYEDYMLDTHSLDEKMRSEELDQIKVLFMENLKQILTKFGNDELNTSDAVHVTDSILQNQSEVWKKQRCIRITASQFKDFLASPKVL